MTEEIIVKMLVCKHGLLSILLSGYAKHLWAGYWKYRAFLYAYVCLRARTVKTENENRISAQKWTFAQITCKYAIIFVILQRKL